MCNEVFFLFPSKTSWPLSFAEYKTVLSVKWKKFKYLSNKQLIFIEAPAFWIVCNESIEKWNNVPG